MIDRVLQNLCQKPLIKIARLINIFFVANQITLLGFIFGLLMCFCIFFKLYLFAFFFLLLNRFSDGLDGAIARLNKPTAFGGYLDITCDFLIYSGFVFTFGLDSENTLYSLILIFTYIGTGTTFLARAAIVKDIEKAKGYEFDKIKINKNLFYTSGLIEGFETIIFMTICLIFPNYFKLFALFFSFLCCLTVVSRIYVCYKELN